MITQEIEHFQNPIFLKSLCLFEYSFILPIAFNYPQISNITQIDVVRHKHKRRERQEVYYQNGTTQVQNPKYQFTEYLSFGE